ncbi:insulinase family protein [filamentous cyanobacterium LEGE 11480]|uniref:Insulinase family protein n=1 Tax=Romeriopsis navalis LEGE 11480 TaxID=2777977 RepID=A0A928VMQ8_9CYAN|nr:pitrilysin family protein [Romeriopsis navalis]MBE9029242.1 insulinase family protein [Romeriopsis navalis LEGE 11480]
MLRWIVARIRVLLAVLVSWLMLAAPALALPVPPAPTAEMLAPAVPVSPAKSIQPYLDRVMDNVTEFTLDNELKFVVLERHQAPVVSFMTYADVGGSDEPPGYTGIAHYLEHLAFKGTDRIGTTDAAAEQRLLEKLDVIAAEIQQVSNSTDPAKSEKLKDLQDQFKQTEVAAQQFVEQNKYGQIVQQSGGTGLNANTSSDATRYFYSFPSNKLELWMSLESERFLKPVFREFYKEKQVILEERRMRTENSPIGQLIEVFLAKAFTTHPYQQPVIGSRADLERTLRPDVQKFFETYYVPNNLTIAIVGDVDPVQVKQLAQTYFGRFPKRPAPPAVTVVEPPQTETKEFTLRLNSQPWYVEAYHRPAVNHPDSVVYDALSSILSDGRTSRFYQKLVQEQKVSLNAQSFNGFPGDKYPNLIMFYALTAPGRSVDEVQTAFHAEIDRLIKTPVSTEELDRVKTQAREGLLRSLDSNSGMAQALLEYENKTGSWRNLFKQIDEIAAITPADIQRVAKATFTPENRTIGRILPKA